MDERSWSIAVAEDGSVTLPAALLESLALKPGEAVYVTAEAGGLKVLPEAERQHRGHDYASWRDISHDLLARSTG